MKFIRRNMKFFVVLSLLMCVASVAFAASKPSFLSGAGDAEQKSNNLITSLINWASAVAIGLGTLAFIVGGALLLPFLGQQAKAKFCFLGGIGAIGFGVAGLSLASWLYDKIS